MKTRTRLMAAGGLTATVIASVVGIAMANGDDDQPLTGATLDRAVQAALEHTGGGDVIETEIGDDGAAYGVEIRQSDGRIVEVELDGGFNVIGTEDDDDGASEDGPDDD